MLSFYSTQPFVGHTPNQVIDKISIMSRANWYSVVNTSLMTMAIHVLSQLYANLSITVLLYAHVHMKSGSGP